MKFKLSLHWLKTSVKLSKYIIVLAFVLLTIFGVYSLQKEVDNAWNDKTTWQNPYITLPKNVDILNIKVSKHGNTVKYDIPYALLFNVKGQENDKYFQYEFSLLPLPIVKDLDLNKHFLIPPKDISFTVPSNKPPLEFLDHKIVNIDSWTIFKSHDVQGSVPTSIEIIFTEQKPFGTLAKIKHYINTRKTNKKENLIVTVKSWRIKHVKIKPEAIISKWQQEYFHSLLEKTNVLKLNDSEYYTRILNDPKTLDEFWNNVANVLGHDNYYCRLEKPCTTAEYLNPTPNFIYFMYDLAYYNKDLFKRVEKLTYKYFADFHTDEENQEILRTQKDIRKSPWQTLRLYQGYACPVNLWKENKTNTPSFSFFKKFMLSGPRAIITKYDIKTKNIKTAPMDCKKTKMAFNPEEIYRLLDFNCLYNTYSRFNCGIC